MRHSMRALLSVMLVGWCCCQTVAAESGSRWWPFGGNRSADVPQPSDVTPSVGMSAASGIEQQAPLPQYSSEVESERRWMIESPLAKVSWPRVHLPEVPKPQLPTPRLWPKKSEVDAARNTWVEESPDPERPSPLQAMTDGARRVRHSTRAAWDKTVDVVTQTDRANSDSSRVARREARPPLWKRMFGGEEQQTQGPQTVTEWMAQERLEP
jgi:hypothetical protein